MTAQTGTADLYPGFAGGDVYFSLTNTNPYAITFTSITSAGTLGLNDVLTVTAGACTLHVGPVSLGGDYVLLGSATWSGTGANSSEVLWNAAARTITIRLGALASGTPIGIPILPGTAVYTPNASITDVAGNGIVTTPFSAAGQRL